jgi:F-type H+-transporting ATPase subunit a
MNDHSTWFHLIPGYQNFESWAQHYLGRSKWPLLGDTHFTMTHVVISAFIAVLLIVSAIRYSAKIRPDRKERLVPEARLGTRNLFDLLVEGTLGIAEGVMGRKKAEKYLPLIGTLVFFIFFNNIIGLIPGFLPATDTLKTNLALSVLVFVMTHVFGVMEHGIKYFKHFAGPIPVLAPLMIPIEIISHVARPVSLSLRLMGNIAADHKVVSAFFVLIPLLVPLPFMLLGILVSVVQTLVFSLLTMVYIDLAVAHAEH